MQGTEQMTAGVALSSRKRVVAARQVLVEEDAKPARYLRNPFWLEFCAFAHQLVAASQPDKRSLFEALEIAADENRFFVLRNDVYESGGFHPTVAHAFFEDHCKEHRHEDHSFELLLRYMEEVDRAANELMESSVEQADSAEAETFGRDFSARLQREPVAAIVDSIFHPQQKEALLRWTVGDMALTTVFCICNAGNEKLFDYCDPLLELAIEGYKSLLAFLTGSARVADPPSDLLRPDERLDFRKLADEMVLAQQGRAIQIEKLRQGEWPPAGPDAEN